MKPTLTIGILACNEEANIGALLSALLEQDIQTATLHEILVVSDASTDKTDEIVRSFEPRGVKLVRHEKRSGANAVQNTMMDHAETDLLVVLDADIIPETKSFIDGLVEPIINDASVGLTSARLLPATPQTFIEKILVWHHEWKWKLFRTIGDGNNIYTCPGPARAFSKRLYKAFRYPTNILYVPYDAACYMFCIKEKMRFVSVDSPRAIFRCPDNLRDHLKQSSRFPAGQGQIVALFEDDARKAYVIPRGRMLSRMLTESIAHPIYSLSFFVIWCIARARKPKPVKASWDMSASTKKI
ncbi:MAG: hypothetical protein RLZZ26_202 [Candidatus Parcubacteria bacterium]|jgi:glycosyltransferase involved in cell wall biosynthesis